MRRAHAKGVWVPLMLAILGSGAARAANMEDLVSPGPLSTAHAREADECSDCHARFDRKAQNPLCLVCHDDVAEDQSQDSGFHGRLEGGVETPCRSCHGEHRGEEARLVTLVPESFDHERTDMPLRGAHSALSCGACHESDRPHREAPTRCNDCHGEDDPHQGRLGDDCASCHEPRAWSQLRFDHAQTRFPLEGGHAEVACSLCHPQERFRDTTRACADCHRVDDAHRGQLGQDCGACHDPGGWSKAGFDHRRASGFALEGRHATAECQACHLRPPSQQALEPACSACHRGDDDHAGRLGLGCETCHDARAWSPSRFEHTRDAKWELHGAHASLGCGSCHLAEIPSSSTSTPTDCRGCHASVDVHDGSLDGGCEQCHGERSWHSEIRFDHDFSRFPLLGLHQLATCEECHISHRFADAELRCVGCHAPHDVHEGRLGERCDTCHNPNAWNRWRFDHDSQTRFALRGGHEELACTSCHRKRTRDPIELTMRCSGCHLRDSPHEDSFGRDCERCHVEESWDRIQEGMRR